MAQTVWANIEMQSGLAAPGPGYAPHLRCADGEYLGVKVATIRRLESQTLVEFELIYPAVNYAALSHGTAFEIVEGPKVVGIGTVVGA
jgi:hypothetical protein